MKRTYQPNVRRRKRKHGFRNRMATRAGRADPEAPPRQGPQAPLGVTPVQRRNRLSRSRDFDAVYRQGRSVSTRFLTLYWFQREEPLGEPRLGFAVPKAVGNAVVRNRIKRQLREIVRRALEARARRRTTTCSSCAKGLPEAAEANGHAWLAGARRRGAREGGRVTTLVRSTAVLPIRLYQLLSRRSLPANTCKYHPSCSEYAVLAIRKHGVLRGHRRWPAWRLLRCNPWSHGGVDHP